MTPLAEICGEYFSGSIKTFLGVDCNSHTVPMHLKNIS